MKLSKTISILLVTAIFLTANIGFSLSKHLCHGHVKSVAIYSNANKCANEHNHHEEKVAHENSCCDDETDFLQDESFKNLENAASINFSFIPVKLISELVMNALPASHLASSNHIPPSFKTPLPPPVPTNIWNCTYLI